LQAEILDVFTKLGKQGFLSSKCLEQLRGYSLCQLDSDNYRVVTAVLRFLTLYIRIKSKDLEQQEQTVTTVLTLINKWASSNDMKLFKALSKLFCQIVSEWNTIFLKLRSRSRHGGPHGRRSKMNFEVDNGNGHRRSRHEGGDSEDEMINGSGSSMRDKHEQRQIEADQVQQNDPNVQQAAALMDQIFQYSVEMLRLDSSKVCI